MVKSSAYPPLLDGLLELACRDGVDIRPTLLRVLTDLYVQKPAHTAAEETQYVELASGLIDVVDAPTRAAVAGKICAYASAPLAIRQRLAEHGAMPAPTVADTTPNITDDTPDHSSLSRCRDLVELFFAASAGDRCLILSNLDVLNEPEHAAPISSEMSRQLEAAALQCRTGEFTRLLGRALGINPALAERVTRDSSGEPIVIAAKALGMPAAVLQRILLFLNPRSANRSSAFIACRCSMTNCLRRPPSAWWRSGGKRAAYVTQRMRRCFGTTSSAAPAPRRRRHGILSPVATRCPWLGRRTAIARSVTRIELAAALSSRHSRGNAGRRDPPLRQATDRDRSGIRA